MWGYVGLFKQIRRLAYVVFIAVFALIEAGNSGMVRRTFEFYTYDSKKPVVEDRMFRKSSSIEGDIKAYVEEVALGPVSVDFAPLVPKGTKLESFMYRDGTVYASFSEEAALSIPGGKSIFNNFLLINQGIRRNFRKVSAVKLFISGNEVFFNEFSRIFGAD
jgi:hypothetical protein